MPPIGTSDEARARILIVDGCPGEVTARHVAAGGHAYGTGYAAALASQVPGLDSHVLAIADGEDLPQGVQLTDFDGVAWTGSPLSAYEDRPEVARQLELAGAVFRSCVPSFGSCWGLQVMCQALGGRVRANPKGFEIGIARQIRLTSGGIGHVMFEGKGATFDALAVHQDEVCALPPGATVLATNAMSEVQAVEIEDGARSFWGVQYHPEFDLADIASILTRFRKMLLKHGFVRSEADSAAMIEDFRAIAADASRRDVAWRYGLTADVTDGDRHRSELANWLRAKVLPHADRRREK